MEEPRHCINCGKILTAKDITTGCGRKESQCKGKNCGVLLGSTPVRCLGTGEKGCKGKLFLPLGYPAMDFEHTTKCPLCDEVGQFVEVEI